jgi:hypothetical protein
MIGSDPGLGDAIAVRNDTRTPLTIKLFPDDEWLELGVVAPGETRNVISYFGPYSRLAGEDRCTRVDLVAVAPDGREVARRPPPLCLHEVWIVTESSRSPAPT